MCFNPLDLATTFANCQEHRVSAARLAVIRGSPRLKAESEILSGQPAAQHQRQRARDRDNPAQIG